MNIADIANPRQTILVSCSDKGKDNIIALSWHMPVSFEPPLYAICINRIRHSYEMIKNSKQFVVNFMPLQHEKKVLYCGTKSGRDIDKFKETGLEKEKMNLNCPIIKQCSAFMECELVSEFDAGDHVIFVGKIVNSAVKNSSKRIFQCGPGYKFTTTE